MSFLSTLEKIKFPKVLKITEGSLYVPKWRTFKVGECIVVFSCEDHIIVKGCMKSMETRSLKQDLGFIPFHTSELFYDIHCLGNTYKTVEALVTDFPRYLVPTSDLFAIIENEGDCESIRIEKKSLLEVEEIREYKGNCSVSKDNYTNTQDLHGEMLCCSVKNGPKAGLNIILPHTLRCEMDIVQDTERYSLQDIVERFNLPRKLKFGNPQLDKHLLDTLKVENEILASSLSNKMIFFADVGKCNLICVDENIRECSNVVCELVENLDLAHVQVDVLKDSVLEVETFSPVYAIPEPSPFVDVQTYTIIGTEKKSQTFIDFEIGKDEQCRTGSEISDEYIQLWEPGTSTQPSSSLISGLDDGKVNPAKQDKEAGTQYATPPSVLNISEPVPNKERVLSPTIEMANSPRASSPSLPPRHRDKSSSLPLAAVKDNSKRSMSLPTDSLDVSHSLLQISFEDLGVEQLCVLLKEYNLDKLADVCNEEKLDGNFIVSLTDDDFREEPFGLGNFQIKKLNKLKTGWRAT